MWTLTEDTRLAGSMVINWWASQATTTPVFDTNFDVTVTVDGNPHIVDHEIAHTFTTPGVPQLLKSVIPFPDVTATSTVELKIDVKFIDSGNGVTFYYDSQGECSALSAGACASRVNMPVVIGPIAPVANDDFVFISSGETIGIDILANDFDPEGGPLAVQIISGPSSGTAEVTTANSIVYTHDGSVTPSDTIVYRVTDNDGLTADATVHIAIAGACTLAADYLETFETASAADWTVDTAVLVNPAGVPVSNTWQLTNDINAHSPITSYYTDAAASDPVDNSDTTKDVRLVSPEFLVSGGTTLSFWHAFNTEAEFDGGVLEITTDGGATWQDIVAAGGLFIEGGYNGPIGALGSRQGWSGISSAYPEMHEVKVNLAAFNSQTIQFRFRLAQDVLLGVPTGWAIDDVTLDNLYESCVEPTNPPVARADSATVLADGTVATDVRANDSDPDNPDGDLTGHTVEVNGTLIAPQHGTVMVDANGHVVYDHDDGNTATSDTYEYKLVDPDGEQFDTAMVTITIDHGNNAVPEANDDTGTVDAGQSITVDVLANDRDANHSNGELTVTIETSPASGFAALNGDGSIAYTHSGDTATSDSFQYRITDPLGAFDIATVHITIIQDEGGACRNDLCAGDGDGGSYDPDMLTMTFVGGTCADSANSQDDKDDCTDFDPAGASGMVKIKVTNKEDADYRNAKVFFEGAVSEGADFTFSASDIDENDFGSKIFVHVYDADGNVLLQTVEIHTSCSAPLFEGDQFGSVRMGAADVDPEAQMCSAGDGRVHGSGHWSRGT
ncbi:MAG: hypothetical protein HKN42_16880, partial [Granulosicoccus sp.]|nr:hypothetical protein [Granulosicoccus sp.]